MLVFPKAFITLSKDKKFAITNNRRNLRKNDIHVIFFGNRLHLQNWLLAWDKSKYSYLNLATRYYLDREVDDSSSGAYSQ